MTRQSSEILFEAFEAEEGGYWARAIVHSIVTEADTWEELAGMVHDAVLCHFDEDDENRPKAIRILLRKEQALQV